MKEANILVIDDNPAIHLDFKKILNPSDDKDLELESLGTKLLGEPKENSQTKFNIHSAFQGEEALPIVRNGMINNRRFAIAFVDIRMPPGMDGVETTKRLWEIDPEIQIVICTAYSDYSWEELSNRLHPDDRLVVLKKPFENIEVLQLANNLAKKWEINNQLQKHLEQLEDRVAERTAKLAKSLSLVKATLEASNDGILVINNDLKIVDYNKKLLDIMQLSSDISGDIGKEYIEKLIAKKIDNFHDLLIKIKNILNQPNKLFNDTLHFNTGKIIAYYAAPQVLRNKIVGIVICLQDITEQKNLEEQLIHQATHDTLTGLSNRILLFDRIGQALSAAKRNDQMVAILFIDLDHFKEINDSFGHEVGDQALKIIAGRMQKCIRENDTLARLGGDEFILAISSLEKIEQIARICQNLLKQIEKPFTLNKQEISITASIGISLFPKDGNEKDILIRNADAAAQAAKENRNNFKFFTTELNVNIMKRLALESNLRLALEKNEFLLHYQPIVNIATGKIIGVEALLRWQHPKIGMIPPQDFIPTADEIGLMLSIGDWVLMTACEQNKKWQKAGLDPITIAVNFTSKQLAQTGIIEKIMEALEKTGLDPSYLEIELTESAIIEGSDRIVRTLQELKNIGVKIVIDDFGTGYSNLSYLNKLPIDKIKIDRSFVDYISPNISDVAVILAIINICKTLKIKTVAEGVENLDQLTFLKQNHCDEVQGFYFCRPKPPELLKDLIKKKFIK